MIYMIDMMLNRASIRSFKNKKIDKRIIDKLKQVVNSSPTWKNYQDFSSIFITNKNIKNKLSQYNFNQEHVKSAPLVVIFTADLNFLNLIIKKSNMNVDVNKLHNYLISFTDSIIAATNLMNAAVSLRLGTCFLGGVRINADKIIDLLNIKGKCIPTIAIAIGEIDKPSFHIPKHNKVFNEKYDISIIEKELSSYDKEMSKFYKKYFKINRNYSEVISKMLHNENADNMMELISRYYFRKQLK